MPLTEQQLRTLTLAQAIERTDTERALVSQADLDTATRTAISAARLRGVQRVEVGDIALDRATAIVARASGADTTVAGLGRPSIRLRWLARALPVLTLVLGLALDRMANAHRVDLLSPPLLLVLGWNLVMYALLAWNAWRTWRSSRARPSAPSAPSEHTGPAWRPPAIAHSALQALRRWARPALRGRAGPRGLAARIAADFYHHWFAQTADAFAQRAARVLHLCAAAWAGGIALSLVLRGLFVRYQFGWESTFLDAGQVHAVTTVLFWPLTTLFGLAPFSLQDITTTQDFSGQGAPGGRWVWMYVGLLALVVVLPRLALAAWAHWRDRQRTGQHTVDWGDPTFDSLRHSMPGDLMVGLAAPPAQLAAWHSIVASHAVHAQDGALHTAQGDRLRFVDAAGPAATALVDAVVTCVAAAPAGLPGASPLPPLPPLPPLTTAWQAAPQVTLRWADFGESWVLEPALFDHLTAALPHHQHTLARLRATWVEHNASRFAQSVHALAEHLHACTRLNRADDDYGARYAQLAHTLESTLRALHNGATAQPQVQQAQHAQHPHATQAAPLSATSAASARAATARNATSASPALRNNLPLRDTDSTALALGTSAGAAAGAAAGAKLGAMIDLGTGGMTLGAGTALGALLGGTTAWVVRSLQKKEASQDVLQHITEAAFTHYLLLSHASRVPAPDAARVAGRWQAEVTGTVAAHAAALATALQSTAHQAGDAPLQGLQGLQGLLRTMLWGILQRSFGAVPAAGAATAADSTAPGSTPRTTA